MAAPRKQSTQTASLRDPNLMKKVAEKAYYLWEKRGRPHGNDMQDWIEAERLVVGVERGKSAL